MFPMVVNADRYEHSEHHNHHRHHRHYDAPLEIFTGAMIYNQYHYQESEYIEQLEYQRYLKQCQYFLDTRQYSLYDSYCT